MQTIDIHAAKTQLSRLVEQAAAGEEIIIAKAGKPICRLVPLQTESKALRTLGLGAGEWLVPADFDEPLPGDVIDDYYKTPIFPSLHGAEPVADEALNKAGK